MTNERLPAVLAGSFFLIAMISSLAGGGILESGLGDALNSGRIGWGVALELVNAFSVLGIAAALVPVIRRREPTLAAAYMALRVLESVICLAAAAAPLVLLSTPEQRSVLLAARSVAMGTLLPVGFAAGAAVLYAAFYRTRLLPRYLAIWGWIAVALMLGMNAFDVSLPAAAGMVLPIIANEVFMGILLIVRGFQPAVLEVNTVPEGSPRRR